MAWLRSKLLEYRHKLGEIIFAWYMELSDLKTASFEAGSDSTVWTIWAADRSNLLSLVVIRERPDRGSPHHSLADLRYLARDT